MPRTPGKKYQDLNDGEFRVGIRMPIRPSKRANMEERGRLYDFVWNPKTLNLRNFFTDQLEIPKDALAAEFAKRLQTPYSETKWEGYRREKSMAAVDFAGRCEVFLNVEYVSNLYENPQPVRFAVWRHNWIPSLCLIVQSENKGSFSVSIPDNLPAGSEVGRVVIGPLFQFLGHLGEHNAGNPKYEIVDTLDD